MSTSVTRTVAKKKDAGEVGHRERPYDHLYDPVHTLSSETDHARANVRAFASKRRVRRVLEFASMFSDNPAYTIRLDPAEPLPAYADHRWRGHQQQRQEALQQLAGIPPNAKKNDCRVTGPDHWKYYKRPLIPVAEQYPLHVNFALTHEEFKAAGERDAEQRPRHRTVGVQTDYRESETQTDPYSPEYVVRPGTSPSELLQVASFTFGRGLPAGLAEVEMIERARAKRVWEASLPPPDDLSQLDKRRRMMEAREAEEWAFREGEIQKLQEARLAVLKKLLTQRDEAQKDLTNDRLNQVYFKLLRDKEAKQEKINADYMRALRKLEAKRKNARRKFGRIATSPAYVPKIYRDVPVSRSTANDFNSHDLDTYEGLQKLEIGLNAGIKKGKPKVERRQIKLPATEAVELLKKYQELREDEDRRKAERSHIGSLRSLIKKEKPVPRPATPTVEEPPEGDEDTELAVIHLQKLLRGRSIQNEMLKGKKNNMHLIQELRTVHALQGHEQQVQRAEKELVMSLKKQRDEQNHKLAEEDASQARAVGTELEKVFDFMSKELIRLQEERRIHAFTLLAERDRRLREAEESGRRQVEERRRQEEDEIFRQVVQVHQETVDLYLEDVILDTIDKMAEQQAREEIHRRAKEINDIAYAMEESRNQLQSEEIVSEFVYSFLIPEVEKINFREKVKQKQYLHWQAAQDIIQGTSEAAGVPQPVLPSEAASQRLLQEMFSQAERRPEEEQQCSEEEETDA